MDYILMTISLFILVGILLLVLKRMQGGGDKEWPYAKKDYFFSRSEQEFLRVLNQKIDRTKYTIFPKVRLADFVRVTAKGKEYQGWFNRIKSKHIDFIIWDVEQGKIALAIELDGRSHNSKRMQKSDGDKDRIFKTIGLELMRVKVGADFETEVEKITHELNQTLN